MNWKFRIGVLVAVIATMLGGYIAYLPRVWASPNLVSISVTSGRDYQVTKTEPYTTKIDNNKYTINYSGDITYIGKDTNTFTPDITMYRFGTDCWLKLGEPTINGAVLSQKNAGSTLTANTITWASKDLQFKFYPIPIKGTSDFGSFEYEIILANSKAGTTALLSNITFPLSSSQLAFYYQPELTAQEIAEGNIRPDNVVGSYVVFYTGVNGMYDNQAKADYYKTGIAFHIYRPLLIDNAGKTAWADLTITGTSLSIDFTKIANWLNKAKYPVVIDPNFGIETQGGSWSTPTRACGFLVTSGGAGTGVYIKAYVRRTSSPDYGAKTALYTNGATSNLVANGSAGEQIIATGFSGWKQFNFATGPTVAAQDYRLAFHGQSYVSIAYATGGASGIYKNQSGTTYADFPAASYTWDYTTGTNITSIYCNYSAGATYDIVNDPTSKAFGIVAPNTTYYAKGVAPADPNAVVDGDCTFTITNNGSQCDIDVHGHAFTGGVGWTLTAGAPGENTIRISVYCSGQDSTPGLYLTTGDQELYDALAASATKKWDFRFETGTFTDGVAKSTTITLTAVVED